MAAPFRPPTVSRRSVLVSLAGAALGGCGGGGGGASPELPASTGSYGQLRVSGQQLVGPGGSPVMLRGFNWGRWGTAQPQDATDNVSQGANCVRIPLRWWGLYNPTTTDSRDDGAPGDINPANLAILDQMIQWASAAGLWIVLFIDSNCGQDGTQTGEPAYCDPQGDYPNGNNFWSDPAQRAAFIQVWQFVADRYKTVPQLALFEPLPEPDPQGYAQSDLTAFYDQVMSAIRAVAPGIPFLVGARSYDLTQAAAAYDPSWTDVVYTGDLFLRTTGTTQAANIADLGTRLQSLIELRTQYGVPIFVQQAGVETGDDPAQAYQTAMLQLLTQNGIGFTWWEYRDGEYPDGYGVLYQDATGAWQTKTAVLDLLEQYFAAA